MSIKKLIVAAFVLLGGVAAFAQSSRVSGTVIDASDQPVIGATVIELGANRTNGVTTDLDGKFVINVPANALLQVDCIGYVPQEVAAKTEW